MRRGVLLVPALLACAGSPPPPVAAPPPALVRAPAPALPPPPHELTASPLVITLVDGETAQVFHIVDQLSAWYPQAHAQYGEWAQKEMPLDDAERAMLAKHAALRRKRRWGALDQAFDVSLPIGEAARAAAEKKLLPPRDAEQEQTLLEHFAGRLEPLLGSQRGAITELEARLASELPRAAPFVAQLGRFCGAAVKVPVRVVLVANPLAAKGEAIAKGGALVLEVPSGDDTLPTFFHELGHALLVQRRGTIAMAAARCEEPVDDETLEEGLAYAFAPGLVHPAGHDLLLDAVNEDRSKSLGNARVRSERLGLALRTELAGSLEGGHDMIDGFMPKECEAWAKVARP